MKTLNVVLFIVATALSSVVLAEPEADVQIPATALEALEDPEKLAFLRGGTQYSRVLFEISRTRYDISAAQLENDVNELEAMSVEEFLALAREKAASVEIRIDCDLKLNETAAFKEVVEEEPDEEAELREKEKDLFGFENPFEFADLDPAPDPRSLSTWLKRFAWDQGLRAEFGPRIISLFPKDAPERHYTSVYRVPASFLGGFGPNDPGCFPEDPHSKLVFSMRYADLVFEEAGIPFPEGSGAWFDPLRSRVVVQQSVTNLELVEAYLNSVNLEIRKQIRVQTDLFALPVADALQLNARFRGASDHNEMVDAIYEAMSDGDDVEILASLSVIAMSGQRAKTEAYVEKELVTKYEVIDDKETAMSETFTLGHQLEVDPVIGADGFTVDLNLNPEFQLGEPIITTREIAGPISGKPLEISEVERPVARFVTSAAVESGQTLLLGSVTKDLGNGPRVLMCFASVDVVLASR